jgi:orotate phosphoribosyltransferase-like protein
MKRDNLSLFDKCCVMYIDGYGVSDIADKYKLTSKIVTGYLVSAGFKPAGIPKTEKYRVDFKFKWRSVQKLFKRIPYLDKIKITCDEDKLC